MVTRLGSNDPVDLDVRFIAASKRDLEVTAAQGEFRADLLYRLNVATLSVPPLTARREDIPRLFMQLVAQSAARYKFAPPDVPQSALSAVTSRDWPGNVRELRNAADRFVLGLEQAETPAATPAEILPLADQIAQHERALISAALTANEGSLKATYEALGLSRKSLYEKMQKHGLSRESFAE